MYMNFIRGGGYLGSSGLEALFDFTPAPEMPPVYPGGRYRRAQAMNPEPNLNMLQGNLWHGSNEFRQWDEVLNEFHGHEQHEQHVHVHVLNNEVLQNESVVLNTGRERLDDEHYEQFKSMSREEISKFFYLPIAQAARELNVGLTLFKKKCRELGISRWPHRKLMSIQTLINRIQEMGEQGGYGSEELEEYMKLLEHEQKMLEEAPNLQLEDETKRLRQAYFKATYKKRKITAGAANQLPPPPCPNPNYSDVASGANAGDFEGDEQCLVSDCSSSTESGV